MAQTLPRPASGGAPPPPVNTPRRKLPFPLSVYQTAVGKKWVMAITGIILLGFVLTHMLGNLHLYQGPAKTHEYAETLRDLGVDVIPRTWTLWAIRTVLIAGFVFHIHAAYSLSRMSIHSNKAYASARDYAAADFASRTMRWTGPIILLFVLYHLADLTWGWFNPDFVRGDPYHNVVESLSSIPVALLYIVANVALAVHIYHGAWSMFLSLGVRRPRTVDLRKGFAAGFALAILVGNLSFPILVQADVISEEDRQTEPGEFEVDEEEAAR